MHGLGKCLKLYRPRRTSSIMDIGYIELPWKVEPHLEDRTICWWQEKPERVLYETMCCASDGYVHDAGVPEDIAQAEDLRILRSHRPYTPCNEVYIVINKETRNISEHTCSYPC